MALSYGGQSAVDRARRYGGMGFGGTRHQGILRRVWNAIRRWWRT